MPAATLWLNYELFLLNKTLKLILFPVFISKGAKVLNYAKWHKTANAIFVVFTVLFVATRLVIFPFW